MDDRSRALLLAGDRLLDAALVPLRIRLLLDMLAVLRRDLPAASVRGRVRPDDAVATGAGIGDCCLNWPCSPWASPVPAVVDLARKIDWAHPHGDPGRRCASDGLGATSEFWEES